MKFTDWEDRLSEYLGSVEEVAFKWGTNDCFLFVANAVEAMSGMDLAHWLRGKYDNKHGAITEARKLSDNFESSMIKIFNETLIRKDPADASYGDIGMAYIENLDPEATGRTSGIVSENGDMLVPGKDGTVAVKEVILEHVWSIPEEQPSEEVILNWPVVTGCYRISEGCYSCPSYWEYLQEGKDYSIKIHNEALFTPLMNPSPTTYNVAFGSDLFHADTPVNFIIQVFKVMNNCPQHKFEITTKRINQAQYLGDMIYWSGNIALGVAVESKDYKWRIEELRKTNAQTKFISMVPLIGPIGKLDLTGIHSVGAAKETWGYKRPSRQEWFDDIERQCNDQGVVYHNNHVVYNNKKDEVLKWQEPEQPQ